MIKISLVFYEFPASLSELKLWELKNKIYKKQIDEKRIEYTLIDKDEKLFCFDINDFKLKEIEEIFVHSSYIYNKTLIFGKVNYIQLEKIQQILLKLEL
jgi:hypothetical protein